MRNELALHGLAQLDVLEHLCHLVYLVGTALDLELLNKLFLVVPRYGRLVEQSIAQLLRELLQEGVTTVQTAEQVDDGVEAFLDVVIRNAFKASAEFVVRVLSDVNRRELLLVHEVLE